MSSGRFVEWVSAMPAHWDWARLGHVARIYAGGTPSKDNPGYWGGDIPWLNSGCVNQWLIQEPAEYITEEGYSGSSARWVPKGGLVMALAGQGKTKGMVAQLDIDATCNQSMAAIIPAEGEPRYLLYWLTTNYKNIRGMASDDTRDGLNLTMLGQIPVPIPPIPEQKTIAEYLDAETTRIDTLVQEKEDLIDLLIEWRQSVIAQAVTKGLDKDVQMRATKIAWLRDIPVAWNEARLGHISKIYAGGTPSKDNPGYWGGDIPWLNSGCINQWLIQEPAEYITEEGYSGSSARWVPKGGLVMALAGQGKTKGMVAQLDIDATCNQSMAAIIPAEGEPRYLLYWLTTNYKNIRGMASDDTRDGLNLTMLGQIPVPIPPIPEQKTIAEYLDAETTRIDALIAHTTEDINLLKELRAATIADAVLGRIDVRETPHA